MHDTDPTIIDAIAEALPEPGSDPAAWNPDQLVAVIRLYLHEDHRDLKMVVSALHLLAVRDPYRAQNILDAFDLASVLRAAR